MAADQRTFLDLDVVAGPAASQQQMMIARFSVVYNDNTFEALEIPSHQLHPQLPSHRLRRPPQCGQRH